MLDRLNEFVNVSSWNFLANEGNTSTVYVAYAFCLTLKLKATYSTDFILILSEQVANCSDLTYFLLAC